MKCDPIMQPLPDPDTDMNAGEVFAPAMREAQSFVAQAQDMDGLHRAATRIDAMVHELVDQVHRADAATRLISRLHDTLTRRIIEVLSRDVPLEGIEWCWISLGSEGRREQTLSSDQDNGIIFAHCDDVDARRSVLLGLAQRINRALDACGLPLCTGNVMAGNPQWCLSLPEWKSDPARRAC